MEIQIDHSLSGERLDVYIKTKFPIPSRAFIQKTIKNGQVLVNGKFQNPSYRLKVGDKLTYEEQVLNQDNQNNILANLDNQSGFINIIPENIDLNVIYEDEDLFAIDKPSGLVVHPGAGNLTGTVVNALAKRNKDAFGKNSRFGLIHRIDKDTSGILLIAKSERALDYYSSLFEKREVKKTYLCIVNSGINKLFNSDKKLIVEGYTKRSTNDRKKMQFEKTEGSSARYSKTEFELDKTNTKYSQLLAYPFTGRTHQIRIHLKSLGYPIRGDTIYKGEKYERLMLHAYKIELKLLNGKNIVILSNIPKEFISIFKLP